MVSGAPLASLAELNPLRYRGYVYDQETGFYYLQSRYYDPVTARFVNTDMYVSTGQRIVGNNMFAYCNNAPVSSFDHTGKATVTISYGFSITAFISLEYLAEKRLSELLTELLHRRIDRLAGLSGNADREVVLCFLFQQGQDNSLLAVALSNHCIAFPVTDFQPGRSNGSINGMEYCKRELRAALASPS